MENSKNESKVNENPKPTDQVQMEIETVTPDTEKNVVPTTEAEQANHAEEEAAEKQPVATKDENKADAEETANIETVVPDKAKAVASPAQGEEKVKPTADKNDDQDQENTAEKEVEQEELTATENESDEDDAENEDGTTQKDENDERDQIETVSP